MPGATAVFVFDANGDVDAYGSLEEVRGYVEAVDVRDGEYVFLAADGRAIEAVVEGEGRAAHDFTLRLTDADESEELRERLAKFFATRGLDADLAKVPLVAAQALMDAQWDVRWPRRPAWLDRRLHRVRPIVGGGA